MKHKNPLPLFEATMDYIRPGQMRIAFLWNAYARGVLTDDQYETGCRLADEWSGTPQELVEAARKL